MKPFLKVVGKKHILKMLVVATALCMTVLMGGYDEAGASCLDLADIPLDALEQAAPGMIMFVMDDSGSMDWSIMCPPDLEGNGVFNGRYYVFPNPGDNVYGYSSLEEDATVRMQWMSQWAGYNGMYYDPATEYTPWPTLPDADVDLPRSNPVLSAHTLDMTDVWHHWAVVVDNNDAGYSENVGILSPGTWTTWWTGWNGSSRENLGAGTVSAQWETSVLDPSDLYDVQVRWPEWPAYTLMPQYEIWDGGSFQFTSAPMNQSTNGNTWMTIATDVNFTTGNGIVKIPDTVVTADYQINADAVQFVPKNPPISHIARRHYYVRNATGTYLVNLRNGTIEYYRVNLDDPADNREVVTMNKLVRLTDAEAATAGIVTGRSYAEECQNFANWYSFYRRRELTAKNAIASVVDSSDGIFVGLFFINNYHGKDQRVLPVKVNLDGTFYDDSSSLLDILYNYQINSYGTPLRNGLKKAGQFFQGTYLNPGSYISQVSSDTYPYFRADKGGSCQQAFTILFTDGYYNGGDPSLGNADGDDNTDYDGDPFGDVTGDTLADVAMYYFERDLNTTLPDDVPITQIDPANHQHMVTYTIAFGVTGDLDTELYKDCPVGACPALWPDTTTSSGKIDDMFHAAINGRGKFISAKSTAELNEALTVLKNDIDSRLGAAAALATNSIQRTVGSVVYQGIYNTSNWYGEVSALPLNVTSGVVGDPIWRASDHVPAWDDRNILSYNGSAGIVFDDANLSATQISQLEASGLGTAAQIVDFIRGDTSNNGGLLRTRTHILGDFVHSAPTYFKNVVYIGGNDGMLHAFDATTGEERFAYVPGLVYDHLADLADPGYSHQFYVDNTPAVADIGASDLLVGGLRKGGKGYFALDVTDPTAMGAGNVLWEFPVGIDDDMGYSYSEAVIVKTEAQGFVVIFGNGYDSVNGEAVLYVLEAATGNILKQFKTGVAGCNGLSKPALVDMEMDGYADYAFAGDLKGNMWKFDLRGQNVSDWTFSYMDGTTPRPLITVKNSAGEVQPITAAPEVMLDCVNMAEGRGLMVLFGTGQYLNKDDFNTTAVQSMYGVWDWGPMWEAKDDFSTAQTKYLGILNTDRSLTNMTAGVGLLEQVIEVDSADWLLLSDNPITWYDPVADSGTHMGWVIDLAQSGERSIYTPFLSEGVVLFVSTIPSSSPCDAGGSSIIYQFDACSGSRTNHPVFDTNDDGVIDPTGEPYPPGLPEPPTGKKVDISLLPPLPSGGSFYFPNVSGGINSLARNEPTSGMFYWRVLGQ